jgi:hypothetical protein
MDVEGMTGVEGTKKAMIDRFDPKSELFDEDLHVKYVDYLAKEIYKKESKARMQIISKGGKDGSDAVKLNQKQIAALETTNFKEGEVYGDVKLKGGSAFIQNIGNVKVDVNPAMLLDGQGDIYDQFVEEHKLGVGRKQDDSSVKYDEKETVEALVKFVGITTDNIPVAKIEYNTAVFLLPLDKVSSIIEKSGKAGKGRAFEILQYSKMLQAGEKTEGETTTPTQGVGAKYN